MQKIYASAAGKTKNIITLAALLARNDWPLSAFFMPDRKFSLESTLLMGCPSYDSAEETLKHGEIFIIEDELLKECASGFMDSLRASTSVCAAVIFSGDAESGKEKRESLELLLKNENLLSKTLIINICGALPEIGADVCEADAKCGSSLHEPIPEKDYNLDISEAKLSFNGKTEEFFMSGEEFAWAEPVREMIRAMRGNGA